MAEGPEREELLEDGLCPSPGHTSLRAGTYRARLGWGGGPWGGHGELRWEARSAATGPALPGTLSTQGHIPQKEPLEDQLRGETGSKDQKSQQRPASPSRRPDSDLEVSVLGSPAPQPGPRPSGLEAAEGGASSATQQRGRCSNTGEQDLVRAHNRKQLRGLLPGLRWRLGWPSALHTLGSTLRAPRPLLGQRYRRLGTLWGQGQAQRQLFLPVLLPRERRLTSTDSLFPLPERSPEAGETASRPGL
ncbi:uncharacterized protein LOC122209706 isoform X1 [Panthera leo]|uniref:uncharacterized protein LOC122209706 isoform X1 n=1 Tax=Panthera leo TaxID=9689 RepID=UPI001C6993AA|nr:uncharacterized protein LOC122209706 isoform X1 [Panthera leo]